MRRNGLDRTYGAGRTSNREIKRRALRATEAGRLAIEMGSRASMILLSALHASGGSITITEQQIADVGGCMATLDYSITDGPDPGTSVIRLVGDVTHKPLGTVTD